MIEISDEMRAAFRAEREDWCDEIGCGRDDCLTERLAAVLAIVEREQRGLLADELEEYAAELWRTRRGEVGIEYVNGIEAAAHRLRSS